MGDSGVVSDSGRHGTDHSIHLDDPGFRCQYGEGDSYLDLLSHNLSLLDTGQYDTDGDNSVLHLYNKLHSSLGAAGKRLANMTYCQREWDNVICWPETLEGQMAILPCFDEFNGIYYDTTKNATRYCMTGGNWTKSDYSECRVLNSTTGPNDGSNLAITTGVYFFGYCVSLGALVIAILIFLAFKELRCLRNTIHTHLMITYVLADTLWIITSSTTITSSAISNPAAGSSGAHGSGGELGGLESSGNGEEDNQTGSGFMSIVSGGMATSSGQTNQVPCITFIMLHYFHLTNFFWMFVEGLYLYVLVVKTFVSENIKLRTYASIGWGVPMIVVIAWSIAKWITQSDSAELQMTDPEFTASSSCLWLPVNDYDWIYKAPVILVLASNLIFLLQIMWVLITKLRSAMNPETQQSIKAAKALVVLMPLLGITYVLVLSGSREPIYEYLRALLISTQGCLVALLYCFLNGEVRQAIRHRWNRLRMMGPICCDFEQRRHHHNMHQMPRDWSPRSRTESIRLVTWGTLSFMMFWPLDRYACGTKHNYGKRESTISEATTLTTLNGGVGSTGSGSGGHGHSLLNRAAISPSPRRGIGQVRPPPSPLQLYQSHQQVSSGATGGRAGVMYILNEQRALPQNGDAEHLLNASGDKCTENGFGTTSFSCDSDKDETGKAAEKY